MRRREIEAEIEAEFAGVGYRATGWQRTACPACVEEGHLGKKNLAVNPATGGYICWRCGISGVVKALRDEGEVHLAAEVLGITTREIRWELPKPWVSLGEGLDDEWTDTAQRAREFLRGRGMSHEALVLSGAGISLDRFWRGYVLFPAWGWDDKLAGWVARKIPGGEVGGSRQAADGLKYRYPKGFERTELYNAERLRVDDPDGVAILTEGILDVWACPPDGVGLWGKGTEAQAQLVAAVTPPEVPIVVALDGDAWRASATFAGLLRSLGVNAHFARLPSGEDLSSLFERRSYDRRVRAELAEAVRTGYAEQFFVHLSTAPVNPRSRPLNSRPSWKSAP